MKHRASVTFEKIVENNVPLYKFVSCNGVLQHSELPKAYTDFEPNFWRCMGTPIAISCQHGYMEVGDCLTVDEYRNFTTHLSQSGVHLTDILRDEAEHEAERKAHILKEHNGTVVFKV